MQVPLPLMIFFIPLIMVVASDGERGVSNKEWSTLLDQGSPTLNGVGTWKARFMSEDSVPVNIWHKSKNNIPVRTQNTVIDKNSSDNMQFTVTNSYKLGNRAKYRKTERTGDLTEERGVNPNETLYANWKGNKDKQDTYSPESFTQPTWQIPLEKVNTSNDEKENLTVFPLSILHKIWHSTDHIRRNGDFDDDDDESFDDATEHQGISHTSNDECLDEKESMSGNQREKGDTDTGESQMNQGRGGMGGGQPILLIKDKGDGGGETHPSSSSGKESLVPLIMMLTPLIMMCIMMPMMMSIMGGMLNFTRTMTTMMVMISQGGSLPQSIAPKYRKSDEENQNRAREYLNSFILELTEKLEEAISRYGDE